MNHYKLKYIKYYTEDILFNRTKTVDLFFRLLSLIYLICFCTLANQLYIFKANGIIPIEEFKTKVLLHEGYKALYEYPSVFWLNQTDSFIVFIILLGIFISIIGFIGKHFPILYLLNWFFYLSFVTFGRDLFLFPWDTYLLEIGFLSTISIMYIKNNGSLPRFFLIAFILLFFRQWTSMFITKLLYSDISWSNLTFMQYFWSYQPSPTPISKYLQSSPILIQKIITLFTLLFELIIPLILVLKYEWRKYAFYISFIISIFIQLSGNFGFFNILTITISIWLLTNKDIPIGQLKYFKNPNKIKVNKTKNNTYIAIVMLLISFNILYLFKIILNTETQRHPMNFLNYTTSIKSNSSYSTLINTPLKLFATFRIVSPHGVFKYIPRNRTIMRLEKKINNNWVNIELSRRDKSIYYFEAPYMNRTKYYCFYQPLGKVFWKFHNINKNRLYLESYGTSILIYHFKKYMNETKENTETTLIVRLITDKLVIDESNLLNKQVHSDTIILTSLYDINRY